MPMDYQLDVPNDALNVQNFAHDLDFGSFTLVKQTTQQIYEGVSSKTITSLLDRIAQVYKLAVFRIETPLPRSNVSPYQTRGRIVPSINLFSQVLKVYVRCSN